MREQRDDTIWIALGDEIPGVDAAAAFAARPDCGAVNIFTGITRNHEKGRQVQTLYYDCYEEMALTELHRIAAQKREKYRAGRVAIFHRTGEVPVGACSLVVAVSSPHRKEALEATRDIIDTLKKDVPIWKKETFRDGAMWKEEQ
jgi:molybdopterin synthase catalytic subunit